MTKRLVAFLAAAALCFGAVGVSTATAGPNTAEVKSCHGQVNAMLNSVGITPGVAMANLNAGLFPEFGAPHFDNVGAYNQWVKEQCNADAAGVLCDVAFVVWIIGGGPIPPCFLSV